MSPVIENFSNDLRGAYKIMRDKPQRKEWPPHQPTSIVNVTVIHYKNQKTRQELIKVSDHDTYCMGELVSDPPPNSAVTKDISEIFKIDPADQIANGNENKSPQFILIEGAPGIGKTVLAKEISYLWADHKLLTDCKLVILVYLRDPRVHFMKSVKELIELYTSDKKVTTEVINYLEKSKGLNVAFVFDGFDEFPASQEGSIVMDIIGISDYVRKFCKSTVVVTSRPIATLFLHGMADRRIEILGFAQEERDKLISHFVSQYPDGKGKLEKYFKQHPVINGLCYIPLNLAILLYLFCQGDLPETLTEMNESFIIHTIYRHKNKSASPLTGYIKNLKDIPQDIICIINKLSKLAFEGAQKHQLVFTSDELKNICPEVCDIPEAANGFSLLQAVHHYSKKGAGTTITFNFLHSTIQEYLAAYYVSTLSEEQQVELLLATFWDDHFNFMWMMYVGIVGVKSVALTSFLEMKDAHKIAVELSVSTKNRDIFKHIENMRHLHLFQCYVEAKTDAEMPQKVSNIFCDGDIDFSNVTLLSHHVISLLLFMFTYSARQWKSFTLYKCNLQKTEMHTLLYNLTNNIERISNLGYFDLSENFSSPWGIYSVIIRHSCVDSLTLCGDQGMNEYIKEITDSLQANKKIQSLALFSVGKIGVECIKTFLMNYLNLKNLKISWQKSCRKYYNPDKEVLVHSLFSLNAGDVKDSIADTKNAASPSYNTYICYRFSRSPLSWSQSVEPDPIYLSHENIDDNAVYVLMFGLCNNTTVQELNLPENNITDEGGVVIIDCLNTTIKTLNLSRNKITGDGMKRMAQSIEKRKTTLSLEYVDLSKNSLSFNKEFTHHMINTPSPSPSPWGVYCAIIRHCCVGSLALCGDEGMDEYIEEITESLQANAILQSLTLSSIGTIGLQSIKEILINNSTLKTLNLSLGKVNFKLLGYYVQCCKLLSQNFVMDSMKDTTCRGIANVVISYDIPVNQKFLFILFLGNMDELIFGPKSINLSDRTIFDDSSSLLAFWLCNNTKIVELNISDNMITGEGAIAIIQVLKCNNTLKKLDLSKNMIRDNGMNEIIKCIEKQRTTLSLDYIDLSKNCASQWGVYCAIIRYCCVENLTVCGDELIDDYMCNEEIIKSLDVNKTLRSLTVCNVDKNIYADFEHSIDRERIYEDICATHAQSDAQTKILLAELKPYKKLRCYSLNSSCVVNDKITLVVNINEKDDCEHKPSTNYHQSIENNDV